MNLLVRFYTVISILLVAQVLQSQSVWISEKGGPLNTVDLEVMPLQDNSKLNATSRSIEKKEGPFKFATPITQSINIASKGTWETLDDGRLLWRQRILSPGAYSLNLGITKFYLPPSAKLFLYDHAKSYVVGPLTNKDNEKHNQWWSPIIPGQELVLEIQIDPSEKNLLQLEITKVNHDYKGFGAAISGTCNVDVICNGSDFESLAIIDRFRDIINSVGMYTLNGIDQCSGSLINTVRNDCTPYFLTANHCDVRENNAASVVVYWNYQNSTCRLPGSVESGQTGDGLKTMFNSGATVAANYDQSDVTLLLLDDLVDPVTNPFYAGWDVEGEIFDSTICIHQPQTQEKRISFDFDPNLPRTDEFFHRISDWDVGTTEGGSSGSPLFNMQKRIIGTLTGGDAACNNDLQDDFGMLKISWEGGGTAGTRLRDWLDPDNTGVTQLDGRFCVDVVKLNSNSIAYCTKETQSGEIKLFIQSGYTEGASVSIFSASEGLSVSLSSDTITISDTIIAIVEVTENFNTSNGEVIIRLTDAMATTDFPVIIIVDDNVPPPSFLLTPINGARNINFDVNFSWDNRGLSHILQIAQDSTFTGDIRQEEIKGTNQVILKDFTSKTIYYWRVKSINECGEGEFSSPFQFTTGLIQCTPFIVEDLPIIISEEAVTINSFVDINIDGIVADVNILNLSGKHTWIGDLTFTLISPSGTEVRLAVSPCDDEDDFNISFDDETDNIILPCPLNDDVPYRPLDDLSAFDDESSLGRWTLKVDDDARLDGGSLDTWTLELCLNLSQSRSASFTNNIITVCEKDPLDTFTTEVTIFGEYSGDVNLILLDSTGASVNALYSANPISGSGSLMFTLTVPNPTLKGDLFFITSDDNNNDTTIIKSILADIPPITDLIAPLHEATELKPRINFEWSEVEGISLFQLIVATDSSFNIIVLDTMLTTEAFQMTNKLALDQLHFWKVISLGQCSDVSSTIQTFRTDLIDATIDLALERIKIFPNPAGHQIILSNSNFKKEVHYELINTLGIVLQSGELKSTTATLDISSLIDGIYLVRLKSQKGILVKPIIKSN